VQLPAGSGGSRRGIDDSPESCDRFYQILDGAFDAGVAAVTLHGRTVEQRYNGPSRWAFLKEVKTHLGDRILLGSGDLFTAQDCIEMIRQTGIDGVTIARGAIGNPWIFEQCLALQAGKPLPPPPSLFTQREVILEHYRLAEEIYGADRAGPLMRKFGIKYAACHPQTLDVRNAFVRVRNYDDWSAVLAKWYAEDLPGRYPTAEDHRAMNNCGVDAA
jgi:tRNA-dihydrouridine synthase B